MTHDLFFQFEADFVQSLRCIPMQVRYKLDTCGVKLQLQHWNQLNDRDRRALVDRPCDTTATIQDYRDRLRQLVHTQTGSYPKDLPIEEEPPWSQTDTIPADVLTEAARWDRTISIDQWRSLSDLQRFALMKLSRPGHENRNFQPALIEFGLTEPVKDCV
ncbi:MAG: nitrate reductase associated protein [Oscillatoriales cyanobacterium]|nr:MAG: nitrate reductase associated protein [Oscillatoriales cyanobacterium]